MKEFIKKTYDVLIIRSLVYFYKLSKIAYKNNLYIIYVEFKLASFLIIKPAHTQAMISIYEIGS